MEQSNRSIPSASHLPVFGSNPVDDVTPMIEIISPGRGHQTILQKSVQAGTTESKAVRHSLDRMAQKMWETKTHSEIEISAMKAEISRKTRIEIELLQKLKDKERIVLGLKNHNKILQQTIYDNDQRRRDAIVQILENQTPDEYDDGGKPIPLKQRKNRIKGTVDEELKQAMEELKAFKPLQTPVSEWYRTTVKIWQFLSVAFVGVTIPDKPTQKLIQIAKNRLIDERKNLATVLKELQYHQLRIIKKLISAPKLYEEAQTQIEYYENQTKDYSSIIQNKDAQLLELQTSWDKLSEKYSEINSTLTLTKERLSETQAETEKLQEKTKELEANQQQNKQAHQSAIDAMHVQIRRAETRKNSLEKNLEIAETGMGYEKNKRTDIELKLKECLEQKNQLEENEKKLKQQDAEMNKAINALKEMLKASQGSLEDLERADIKNRDQINVLHKQNTSDKVSIEELKLSISHIESMKSKDRLKISKLTVANIKSRRDQFSVKHLPLLAARNARNSFIQSGLNLIAAIQTDKVEKQIQTDKVDKETDKVEKQIQTDKADKEIQTDKVDKEIQIDKADKETAKVDKEIQTDHQVQTDKVEKQIQTDKVDKEIQTDKVDKETDKVEKQIQTDKADKKIQIDKVDKETDKVDKEIQIDKVDKETDKVDKQTDKVDKETDKVDKETQIDKADKETDKVDKQTDKVDKETDKVDKEIQTDKVEKKIQIDKALMLQKSLKRSIVADIHIQDSNGTSPPEKHSIKLIGLKKIGGKKSPVAVEAIDDREHITTPPAERPLIAIRRKTIPKPKANHEIQEKNENLTIVPTKPGLPKVVKPASTPPKIVITTGIQKKSPEFFTQPLATDETVDQTFVQAPSPRVDPTSTSTHLTSVFDGDDKKERETMWKKKHTDEIETLRSLHLNEIRELTMQIDAQKPSAELIAEIKEKAERQAQQTLDETKKEHEITIEELRKTRYELERLSRTQPEKEVVEGKRENLKLVEEKLVGTQKLLEEKTAQLKVAQDDLKSTEKLNETLRTTINKMTETHRHEIEELERLHKNRLKSFEDQSRSAETSRKDVEVRHTDELQVLRTRHEEELNAVQQQHELKLHESLLAINDAVAKIETKHSAEMASIKLHHENAMKEKDKQHHDGVKTLVTKVEELESELRVSNVESEHRIGLVGKEKTEAEQKLQDERIANARLKADLLTSQLDTEALAKFKSSQTQRHCLRSVAVQTSHPYLEDFQIPRDDRLPPPPQWRGKKAGAIGASSYRPGIRMPSPLEKRLARFRPIKHDSKVRMLPQLHRGGSCQQLLDDLAKIRRIMKMTFGTSESPTNCNFNETSHENQRLLHSNIYSIEVDPTSMKNEEMMEIV